MFQRLRRNFILVIMGMITVILLIIFGVLMVTTSSGLRRESELRLQETLNHLSQESSFQEASPDQWEPGREGKTGNDGPNKKANRLPGFTAMVDSSGIITINNRGGIPLQEYTTEQLEDLVQIALNSQASLGDLTDAGLRFATRTTAGGTFIAFTDISMETAAIRNLLRNSLLVGLGSLILFFLISIFLARWAVRPAETAWLQQKQFVGDASHELKTPLTVILSNADMILSNPHKPPERWAENIKLEGKRMKRLTEELLSLARSDSDAQSFSMEPLDFSYLVTESVLLFEPVAFEQGKTLMSHIAQGLCVRGDGRSLGQLLEIFLENAVKYSDKQGEIIVSLEGQGKNVLLSVSNSGPEIPAESLPHLFERFYRGDPSRGETGGHGLGLSIARNIALAHRGKIWAQSDRGINTFSILLPGEKRRKNS